MIAVRHILWVPAAAGCGGAGRGQKAVYRRLRFAGKVLFGLLRGDLQQSIDRSIRQRIGKRLVGVELCLQREFGARFQQCTELGPQGGEKDRNRESQYAHADEMERASFQKILKRSHHGLLSSGHPW